MAAATRVTEEHRRTPVGDTTVASRRWTSAGDGTEFDADPHPVVLVHGLVVSSRYHAPLASRLAGRRPVWAPDLPGFGESDQPDHVLDTRELGSVLAGWMDAESLAGATVVANSYGCQVATETLLARPDLASRLVLLGPTIDPQARSYHHQLRRWRREQRTQSRALQRILLRDYARAGVRRALATFRNAMHDAIEDRLPFIDLPTLVCRGSRDPIVSPAWAREVARLLPRSQLRVLPGATHAITHEMPRQTARVIEHYLAEAA
jgi:2-hydroxy-6-oxonona-2,4-dienedioate hydrolase